MAKRLVATNDPSAAGPGTALARMCVRTVLILFALGGLLGLAKVAIFLGDFEINRPFELWLTIGWSCCLLFASALCLIGTGHLLFQLPLLRGLKVEGFVYLTYCVLTGAFAWQCWLIGVGAVSGLGGWMMAVALAPVGLVILLSRRHFVGFHAIERQLARWLAPLQCWLMPADAGAKLQPRRLLLMGMGVVATALVVMPYVLATLLPAREWDTLMYHLPMARQYLDHGVWILDPVRYSDASPGTVHLYYAILMGLGGEPATILLNLLCAIWLIVLTGVVARDHWGPGQGILAAGALLATHMVWVLAVDGRVELFHAWVTLLAFDAFLRWARSDDEPGWIICVGMAMGIALGIKMTALLTIAPLGLIWLYVLVREWGIRSRVLKAAAPLGFVCMLLPACFWYGRNVAQVGVPFYPTKYGVVYVDSAGETARLKPAIKALVERNRHHIADQPPPREKSAILPRHMYNWSIMLWAPAAHGRQAFQSIGWALPLAFLLPLLVWRDRRAWWLLLVIALFYLPMARETFLARYLLPIFPLMAVGAGVVLMHARTRPIAGLAAGLLLAWPVAAPGWWLKLAGITMAVAAGWLRKGLWIRLLILAMLAWVVSDWFAHNRQVQQLKPWAYLRGEYRPAQWQCATGTAAHTGCWVDFINEHELPRLTDEPGRIMLLMASCGHYLQAPWTPDLSGAMHPLLVELIKAHDDIDAVYASLRRQGYTHLVFTEHRMLWAEINRPGQAPAARVVQYYLRELIQRYGEIVYTGPDGTQVIRLHRHATASPAPAAIPHVKTEENDR